MEREAGGMCHRGRLGGAVTGAGWRDRPEGGVIGAGWEGRVTGAGQRDRLHY